MINIDGKQANLLTVTRDMFTGNIKHVFIVLTRGILLSYAFLLALYFFGIIHEPPSLNSFSSLLFGQFLLVSFALWINKKYPKHNPSETKNS